MPLVAEALEQAEQANVELRELVHGILPPALQLGGLPTAVKGLASRMSLPVELDIDVGSGSPTRSRRPPTS